MQADSCYKYVQVTMQLYINLADKHMHVHIHVYVSASDLCQSNINTRSYIWLPTGKFDFANSCYHIVALSSGICFKRGPDVKREKSSLATQK